MIEKAVEHLIAEQTKKLQKLADVLPIVDVEQTGTTVLLRFDHPRNGRAYVLRFRCDGYPLVPPSVHFVDTTTHEDSGATVWPTDGEQAIKTTSNPRFICLPGTREYHNAHGGVIAGVHSMSLPVIFQHIIQALEVRG